MMVMMRMVMAMVMLPMVMDRMRNEVNENGMRLGLVPAGATATLLGSVPKTNLIGLVPANEADGGGGAAVGELVPFTAVG